MGFSLRSLFGFILACALILVVITSYLKWDRFYNHTIAEFELGRGYTMRIFSCGIKMRGVRHRYLDWTVTGHGKKYPTDGQCFPFLYTDDFTLLKSQDGNYFCLTSQSHPKVLILGDLRNAFFFRSYTFLVMDDRQKEPWRKIIKEFADAGSWLDTEKILSGQTLH